MAMSMAPDSAHEHLQVVLGDETTNDTVDSNNQTDESESDSVIETHGTYNNAANT